MPKVQLKDLIMYYQMHGEGETLVFIAGLGGDHTGWQLQLPEFSSKYQCLVFDNRGVGQTDKPKRKYTTRLFARDTAELMETLKISQAHIVGLSMGGAIAQELAISYPEKVRSLVLVATWPRADEYLKETAEIWITLAKKVGLAAAWKEHFLWALTPDFYQNRGEELQEIMDNACKAPQSREAFVGQVKACLDHDALDRLEKIEARTLIILGEEDILTPLRFARVLQQRIGESELVLVEKSGHALPFENPEGFNREVLKFLSSQE